MQTILNHMISLATDAMHQAYSPYSKFKVGASIEGQKGGFFCGCNVENSSYSLTSCAEANAIADMIRQGETAIKSILIIANSTQPCPPCGACRQRIYEFSNKQTKVYMVNQQQQIKTLTIDELLPFSFSAKILGNN